MKAESAPEASASAPLALRTGSSSSAPEPTLRSGAVPDPHSPPEPPQPEPPPPSMPPMMNNCGRRRRHGEEPEAVAGEVSWADAQEGPIRNCSAPRPMRTRFRLKPSGPRSCCKFNHIRSIQRSHSNKVTASKFKFNYFFFLKQGQRLLSNKSFKVD